jgi:hypothetical protein
MMTHQVRASRDSYFNQLRAGNLRFTETSPVEHQEDHQICNCTKAVSARPSGTPRQVTQVVEVREQIEDRHVELRASAPDALFFTFMWSVPGAKQESGFHYAEKRAGLPPQTHHAYFWVTTSKIQIEIIKPGYGLTGCFFGHLFMGNKVDTSTLFNGHSPSRVVELENLSPEDIWCHDCGFGTEATELLNECPETEFWRDLLQRAGQVSQTMLPILNDHTSDIETIRHRAQAHTPFTDLAAWAIPRLNDRITNLDTSELFLRCDSVYRQARLEKAS